ncbi:response regulator transcription factor [Agaribacterium sp. ZY112]|uniref:response regulator transcription factor n=1 Tax=Agaribacterium sp. ZY112 TaxID=3233574 RepID=UPI003523E204
MNAARILLVEDDEKLAALTANFLCQNGYLLDCAASCEEALELVKEKPDLILLDLGLPDGDGITLCAQLREYHHGPILMLTARDSTLDQVVGLDAGADDFLSKPIEPMVLLARIRAFLRQRLRAEAQTFIEFKSLKLSSSSQQVWLNGEEVRLSSMEFLLLELLVKQAGHVVSREALCRHARGVEYDGLDRTVDIRISRMRKKLGDQKAQSERIRSVRGQGYLLVPDAW